MLVCTSECIYEYLSAYVFVCIYMSVHMTVCICIYNHLCMHDLKMHESTMCTCA